MNLISDNSFWVIITENRNGQSGARHVRTYFSTLALAILTSMTSVQQLSALFENIIFAAFVKRLF